MVASVEDPGRDCDVNVRGTLNVVEAARELRRAGRVHLDRRGAVRRRRRRCRRREDRIPAPLSPYGASKWAAEAYVQDLVALVGHTPRGLQAGQRLRPAPEPARRGGGRRDLHASSVLGRAPKLYGHGKPTRDYVYVADVVSALLAASGSAGTYNVATGVETDVMRVWSELRRRPASRSSRSSPICVQVSCSTAAWTSHGRAELGWRPKVPIARASP